MRTNVIPFPLNTSFRQGVPFWTPIVEEEVRGLPGTEVEVRNRTYGGTLVFRAVRYTGSSNLTVQAGQLVAIDTTGGGQAFSALTNAVGQYAFPLSPFITGSLVLVPGDVVWVVVDGVTLVRKTTGAGINAGQFMVPSTTSGLGQAQTTGGRVVGLCMANAASGDANALINVGRSWGEAIP